VCGDGSREAHRDRSGGPGRVLYWHIKEHIPERVGIPGFRRGRRYVALTPETHPEFFTLYETDTMQVLTLSPILIRSFSTVPP